LAILGKEAIPEAAPVTSATPGNNVMALCFHELEWRRKKINPVKLNLHRGQESIHRSAIRSRTNFVMFGGVMTLAEIRRKPRWG
jgi:hypothetical protein